MFNKARKKLVAKILVLSIVLTAIAGAPVVASAAEHVDNARSVFSVQGPSVPRSMYLLYGNVVQLTSNGRFVGIVGAVCVNDTYSQYIATSADGREWLVQGRVGDMWKRLVVGDNTLIAIADGVTIGTHDGENWFDVPIRTSSYWGLEHQHGWFIFQTFLGSGDDRAQALVSRDGVTWINLVSSLSEHGLDGSGQIFSLPNGNLVVRMIAGGRGVYIADGIESGAVTWTPVVTLENPPPPLYPHLPDPWFSFHHQFDALGLLGSWQCVLGGRISGFYRTTDGLSWTYVGEWSWVDLVPFEVGNLGQSVYEIESASIWVWPNFADIWEVPDWEYQQMLFQTRLTQTVSVNSQFPTFRWFDGLEVVTPKTLSRGILGVAYSYSPNHGDGVTVSLVGASTLPAGLALDLDGSIYGIPTVYGAFVFTVLVEGHSGGDFYKTYLLYIEDTEPPIDTEPPVDTEPPNGTRPPDNNVPAPPPGGGTAGGDGGGGATGGGGVPAPAPTPAPEPQPQPSGALPQEAVTAERANAETISRAQAAVAALAQEVEPIGKAITKAGTAVTAAVAEQNTIATLTLPEGAVTSALTTKAILNADGTLTPVPTRVNPDGTVVVLISDAATLVPLSVRANFTDISFGARFAHVTDEINLAASLMIIQGRGNNIFDPASMVTNQEAATMFLRALGVPVDFSTAMATAIEHGLKTTGTAPATPVSRIEAAVLIVNALSSLGADIQIADEDVSDILAEFSDVDNLTAAQLRALAICVDLGIFEGIGGGRMNPNATLQRSHMASLAVRLQNVILDGNL
ncbi:MAG: S-layer homology domain-containing protein [Oscillospiraceae bacterium]|nr:S-layer homology domain-containing protein [Oscillospiraceae bacterium]